MPPVPPPSVVRSPKRASPFDVDPLHHENLTVVPLIWPDPCEPTYTVLDAAIAAGTAVVPLPGVEQDLGNFARVFGGRVNRVFSGAEAEEGRARDVLRQPGFLLVATHGVNTADQPLFSHLMFQPDAENDGLLTAGELYTLPVGADLVVMSACYSGLADRSPLPGDDLFGLQRALLHSGGRAVVSGLWDVYDGTGPELMNGFFQNLHAGLSAPEALAASQRSFLRKLRESEEPEPWLHPYFWAVYKYFGDDRVRLKIDSP